MSRLAMLAAPKIKQHRPSRVGEDRNGEHAARVRWRQPKQHRPSRVGEDRNNRGTAQPATPAKAAPALQGR